MSEINKQKSVIESELEKIKATNQIIARNLREAKSSGDDDRYQSLIGKLGIMKNREETLQTEYSSLQDQEDKPELERIGQLRKELEQPHNWWSIPGYPVYGGAGVPHHSRDDSNRRTGEEDAQRKREIISQLYNAPVNEKGIEAEQLPASVRFGVGALPTPESELEYLKGTFPDANITPIDVGGKTEYLIKKPDGTSFTTLDKGVAGTTGMLAVEAPIAALSAATGVGTALATRSPVAATIAAGGTEAAAGTIADAITRAALGMPQRLGEDAGRRGLEAGIGTALGLGVDVIPSAVIANRIPSRFKNEFFEQFQGSAERLGLDSTAIPAGAQFGPQGLAAGEDLAGMFPGALIASRKRKTQESVRTLFNDFLETVPKTANDLSVVAANQKARQDAFTREIARANNKSELLIDDAVKKILKPTAKTNMDDLGGILRTTIEAAEAQASKSRDKQYEVLADVAERAGFRITPKELLNIIKPIKTSVNVGGAFDDSAVKSVEKRLSKVNEPLDFRAFDAYIRAFNDARPTNAVGGKTKDAFGAGVAAKLSELRRDIYSRFNAVNPDGTVSNLGDEFKIATDKVAARAAFEGNTLGGILRDVVGEQARTPRDIVSSVMKEPFTINRVLQATKELELGDPTQVGITDKLQGMMQLQYLNDLGIGSKKGVTRLDYDQGMLDSLYGNKAAAAARGLDSINDKLKVLKSVNVPEMTLTDLNKLSSALSKDARDEIANEIIKRDVLQQEEKKLVTSEVFKQASKGNFENIDPDLLSKSILSKGSSIGQTKTTMAKLSQSSLDARNSFKGDFYRNLLDDYPGGTASTAAPYTPLRNFDTTKFLADYNEGDSPLAKKMEIVVGKEGAQRFYDFAKIWEGAKITNIAEKGPSVRVLGSPKGLSIVTPVTSAFTEGRNRYLAALLATGSERYGLKAALAKGALPGETNDVYVKTFNRMFTTREGMQALIHQASSDPEFSVELRNAVREFEEKEGLDLGGN
jgi:hypothetical protein